ncbi:MAG: hypothetical protein ACAH59_06650 [Pseudobdellovibrionaceae bacterium]
MRTNFIHFLLFLIFSEAAVARVYEFTEMGSDVRIPVQIWNLLGNVSGKDNITFAPLAVRLVEKTSGVLIEPEIEIRLPRGGGEIDLSKFVKDTKGTFRVFFEIPELSDESKMQVFFISRARKRKLEGEVWGAGCNKYMDIKSFLLGEGKKKGIEVNTTRNRHLSVLGGTFFFSLDKQVTQVTFTDSQQSQLFCETVQVK